MCVQYQTKKVKRNKSSLDNLQEPWRSLWSNCDVTNEINKNDVMLVRLSVKGLIYLCGRCPSTRSKHLSALCVCVVSFHSLSLASFVWFHCFQCQNLIQRCSKTLCFLFVREMFTLYECYSGRRSWTPTCCFQLAARKVSSLMFNSFWMKNIYIETKQNKKSKKKK